MRTHSYSSLANLATIASFLPATGEILHQVGLQRRRSRAVRTAQAAGWVGVGAMVGGGLALLLAPKTGHEVRAQIGDRARHLKDYVTEDEPSARSSG